MNVAVQVGVGQVAVLFFLLALVFVFIYLQFQRIEKLLKKGSRSPAVRIVLALPIIKRNGVIMPNLEIPINSTEYVPLEFKDANGDIVGPPAGDTFTPVSSDPSITPTISTMPSGPLSGALAVALATGATPASNVTITVTDQDGLQQAQQVCDVVAGAPASIFLDVADAVNVPNPGGAAKLA